MDKQSNLPLTIHTVALRDELSAQNGLRCWASRRMASGHTLEVCTGRDSLWILLRGAGGIGGIALRAAYAPGMPLRVETLTDAGASNSYVFQADSSLGLFRVELQWEDRADRPLFRCTTRLTPSQDTLLPYWPRDLYPLDKSGTDPACTKGTVHAAQRGLNAGLVYLTLGEPSFGSLLYFQNLTALNDYYLRTETKPDGCVGGEWPELGYQMPVSPNKPLPAEQEIILSDALIGYRSDLPGDNRAIGKQFIELLADVYQQIERSDTEYHDWPRLAERTLRDLEKSPKVTLEHYGHRYIRPYVSDEYPDAMVQLTVLTPIKEYGIWKQKDIPFAEELRKGISRFYDKELNTIRRYLPNVGDDKDPNEVDSWYLYHPLINLGRLALEHNDTGARDLFLEALEYGIKVAHHFKYTWPIQFNVETLDIIKKERNETGLGQSDVGGIYAYAMLQAWQLTQKQRYLNEACKAIQGLKDLTFELMYQSNLCGWGANACLRLWRITGDDFYRDQSYVFLANYFHNNILWRSEIGNAAYYPTFMAASCLHDGPYMAIYECFESFAAFKEYLEVGENDLPDSIRLLVSEYYKYTLTRAAYYYPENLPKEALATEIRNGEIDRELAFPLEDLYPDGQPAGQVGQEVYGCGAAFALTARAYHRREGVPFVLYSEYPVYDLDMVEDGETTSEQPGKRCMSFRLRGMDSFTAKVRLIPAGRKTMPAVSVTVAQKDNEEPLIVKNTEEGDFEFSAPSLSIIRIYWNEK